jgi:hypothetical protein
LVNNFRNSRKANRVVEVARDGIVIEASVGKRLIGML